MTHPRPRRGIVAASLTALALTLAACSADDAATDASADASSGTESATESGTDATGAEEVTVEDNHGAVTVSVPPQTVVATDNRTFETLADWGIELAAAPVSLMSGELAYKTDESIVDLGSHTEPDLEAVVAVNPDLIVNGQRFAQYYPDFTTLAPEAAIVELDPREGEPLDEELRRQITTLGTVFGKESEAEALVQEFDDAIAAVTENYDPSQTVMAVITSGGSINYSAPTTGRTLGPVFDILGLTPALQADGSTDHQGDDISVEAIADSNPDWILVMDRDAAVSGNTGEEYTPANDLIADSPALQNVTAVQEGNIVYLPQDTYVNEGIQTYTEFFDSFAEALSS